jgi:DNA/RNA endonuclease G (NUC1)
MFARKNQRPNPGIRPRTKSRLFLSRTWFIAAGVSLLALVSVYVVLAAISLSTTTPYTQNFDGMGTSATATLPTDFRVDKPSTVRTVGTFAAAGTTTNFAGGANLSTTASNGIYNFGSGTNTTGPDRALGFLSSGTATQSGNLYAQLVNNTGGALTGLQISYDVEKYRNGSNANGFRIQMFYSADGSTWTNAGSDFLTSFAADANNNGFATAPGATVSIVNKTLNVSVPDGTNLYLAWNYSVAATSITTNAQALAIDNISILGIAGGGPTNPTGVGAANPSSVAPGSPTLLTVTVTPGTNPPSTAHTVRANLSSIGGSATQSFFDDGTNGDVTPNDNVFSFNATVANGTSGGAKTLPVTITETSPLNRTGTTSISLTVLASTNPSGLGAATPNSVLPGDSSTLTVTVTPGTNPTSTGLFVTADLSTIGGSSTQQFFDDGSNGDVTPGNNVFTYATTIPNGTTPGPKSLPFNISDAQSRSGSGSIGLTIQTPPPPVDHVVISQLYGGGGNSGAPFTNDYVELFNPTGVPFSLTGWSLQYASATGTSWTNRQPLGGTIAPGEYYLVSLASGGSVGSPLPVTPNISGDINMSATTGKIALVNNSDFLTGACPVGTNTHIVDFLGYGGTANCREGAANAPAPSNTTALFRKANGSTDTDQNGSDFLTGAPSPRRTAPIVELGPWVAGTDPITDGFNAPHDATVTVNFSEPVDVTGNWYDITCTSTGQHNSATVASSNNFKAYAITPNTNFQFGEQCTVRIVKDGIHDQDLDDGNPNTDTLFEDYVWTFTVVGAGAPAPYPPSVHLTMGNPSNAVADLLQPNNYLMEKPTYTLSYNRDKGTPNWVSWHLDTSWFGSLARIDTFRPDPAVTPDWYRVQATDYFTTGFDRGHMTPNADRDNENRIPINQETYLMSNMVPQAPDNNQGPWANLENDLRSILTTGGENEIYIVSGPLGVGGSGSNGGTTTTIAGGHVTVPAYTWKVALVLPKGDDDVSRVTASSRTIAILMPNTQGIRNNPWQNYLTTVDNIEALTGYDFFANVPDAIENSIEAGINGVNPPGTAGQAVTTAEDTAKNITLTAASPGGTLTYTIVSPPTHGGLTGTAENRSYAPDTDFNGTDSFSFKVNDGTRDSNVSTVNITVTEVNDSPIASNDAKNAVEDTTLNFPASDLTVNDSAGPANESGQNLTVTAVNATVDTHGSVSLTSGTISYSPSANYNGPASFDYQICDDGTTNGAPDPKCATGTVNMTVTAVQDPPDAVNDSSTVAEDSGANSINVLSNDSDVDGDTLTVTAVTPGAHGSVAITGGGTAVSYTPAANFFGSDSFTYTIGDGHGNSDTATVGVTVTGVQDPPDAVNDSSSVAEDSGANSINVLGNDSDVDGDTLTVTAVTQGAHGSVAITGGGTGVSYTPAANFFGSDSFTYTIGDGHSNFDTATVNITVNNVNDAPVAAADNYITNSNTTLNVVAPGVLANDSDIDSPALTAVIVSGTGPSHGSLTLNGNGSFSYVPAHDYTGPDSFSYRAFDGTDYSNVAPVTLTINDTVAPVLTSSVAMTLISTTNSNLINVGLTASATDNSGGPVTIDVAVFGDEDDQTPTDNNTVHSPDAKDIAPGTLRLRGERIEANDGRVYLIVVKATDSAGNISRNYHTVVVPKSNKQANIDAVNAQAAAAASYAQSHNGVPPPGYFVIGDGPIIGPKQ